MSEDRPYLQIPLPSPEEERRLYEEWQKKNLKEKESEEDESVIIVDI